MGVPKYKKFSKSKDKNSGLEDINTIEDKAKVLELNKKIQVLLKDKDNIEKAARLFEKLLGKP